MAYQQNSVVTGNFNVVSDYRWTLTSNLDKEAANSFEEVPYVFIQEYQVDETVIKRQWEFYSSGVRDVAADAIGAGAATTDNPLKPYESLFQKEARLKGAAYRFPYFSDINYQVNSERWQSLDLLEQGAKFAENTMGFFFGEGAAGMTKSILEGAAAGAGAYLALSYPKIGIMDRPKLFSSHDFRTIEVKFPLFNTVDEDDWKKNRSLIWTILNNSLFLKRDFITGIPPVFYEILIPGQHYSFAACMTNITVYNRGNMRKLQDINNFDAIVPDAYEVNMTFTDLVMPSRNLFTAIQTKQELVTVN